MSDSGPDLGIRAVGCLAVLGGMLMIATGIRIRKGTSRFPVPPTLSIYGSGVFIMCGAAVVIIGVIIIAAGI